MKQKEEDNIQTKIAAAFIFCWIVPLILMWYNHVIIQWPLGYWKCWLIGLPFMWMMYAIKPLSKLVPFVTITVAFAQVFAWCDILKLPLIHK